MSLSPPGQQISDNNPIVPTLRQPTLGTNTPLTSDNLSGIAPKDSRILQERQSSSISEGDGTSPARMIAAASTAQPISVLRDAGHRPSQSVPPISPSSPTFRHSATSSISQLPLTPDSSPRYRPKYGKRLSDTSHKVTSPLISKDENEPPISPSSPTYKQTVTFPLRKSEEKEISELKEAFLPHSSTFPLSSPLASPPNSKRKMRPSLEGVFDTPSPKPRNSAVLTPPATEQQERPSSKFARDRERQLPRGENPFIFGKPSARRSTKSEPTTLETDASLQPPAVNVTSPTPGHSPSKTSSSFPLVSPPVPVSSGGKLKLPNAEHAPGPTKTVTYEDEVKAGTSMNRTKSREESAEDDGKLDTYSSLGSKRHSNTTSSSVPPSAFNSSRRNSKSKRVSLPGRISPTNAAVEGAITAPSSSTQEQPRTTTPRPSSRVGSTRARSVQLDANSSRTSIPISAIVNPRPPSVGVQAYDFIRRDEGLYMRDPYREIKRVSWRIRLRGQRLDQLPDPEAGTVAQQPHLKSPLSGLMFYPGFLFPPLWWIASFLKWSSFDPQVASEKRWSSWRVQSARDYDLSAKTWRDRCRFMALVSLVTYLPLIVLLAVFIPK